MRVVVSTELPAAPAQVWELLQSPQVMRHVSRPLTLFTPVNPPTWPERWAPGDHRFRIRVLAVLPIGEQTVSISVPLQDPDAGRYQLRDNGSGELVRTWDHLITVEPVPAGPDAAEPELGRSRYTDQVDVDAGLLTVPVWMWAHVLYRWRQRRWRRLTRSLRPAERS